MFVRGENRFEVAGIYERGSDAAFTYAVRLQHRAAGAFLNCRVSRTLPCPALPAAAPPLTFPQTLHPPIAGAPAAMTTGTPTRGSE